MVETLSKLPLSSKFPAEAMDELASIFEAYNETANRVHRSHEQLQSEVIRLRHELEQKNEQLQRKSRLAALGEMAAGIAHEIRNPLAAIRLFAEVMVHDLARAGVDGTVTDTARKIASAVMGLDAIVDDVLAFAKETTLRPVDLDVEPMLAKVLEAVGGTEQWQCVTVRRLGAPDPDLALHADPALLHQAILNIVRNAIDAMAENGGTLYIGALANPDADGQIVLTVRDTGPGISDEAIDRIFNPFFTTRNTGTGLGLAIVHRIIDAHGGSISVHNDGGAVFEIRLPAAGAGEPRGSGASTTTRAPTVHHTNERASVDK